MPTRAPEPPAPTPVPSAPGPSAGADPAALWSAVVEQLAQRPFFAWLRYLRLDRIEGDTAWVSPVPGHREVQAIATPQRLEPVAQELGRLRGVRTRVSLRTADRPAVGESTDRTAAPEQAAPGFDRRAAMQVPLVRQVLDVFPDAALIDAREETPADDVPTPDTPDTPDSPDDEAPDSD